MLSTSDIIALKSLQGIGDQTIRKIIKSNKSVADLQYSSSSELKQIFRNENDVLTIKNNFSSAKESAEYELEKYADQSIFVISYFDNQYPKNLANIEDFPILLFCKGDLSLFESDKNIAVIGTRDNSQVGQRIARGTANYFAKEGYTIVSGLAKGIDAIAHEAALEVGGKTIAVLVDIGKIYPKENYDLALRILKNDGLLISENSPGSFQGKNSFVLRDRIQSGLSLAIFPIETDVIGGTMHTVSYAKKQGRLIFVPDVNNLALIDMYNNNVGINFSKVNGIRSLINSQDAIPYTKETYSDVSIKITEHYKLLFSKWNMTEEEYINDLFSSPSTKSQTEIVNNNNDEPNSSENTISEVVNPEVQETKGDENKFVNTAVANANIEPKEKILLRNSISKFKLQFQELTDESKGELDNSSIFECLDKFHKELKKIVKPPKKGKKTTVEPDSGDDLFNTKE